MEWPGALGDGQESDTCTCIRIRNVRPQGSDCNEGSDMLGHSCIAHQELSMPERISKLPLADPHLQQSLP